MQSSNSHLTCIVSTAARMAHMQQCIYACCCTDVVVQHAGIVQKVTDFFLGPEYDIIPPDPVVEPAAGPSEAQKTAGMHVNVHASSAAIQRKFSHLLQQGVIRLKHQHRVLVGIWLYPVSTTWLYTAGDAVGPESVVIDVDKTQPKSGAELQPVPDGKAEVSTL